MPAAVTALAEEWICPNCYATGCVRILREAVYNIVTDKDHSGEK